MKILRILGFILIYGVFVCAGLAIAGLGLVMFLHLNNVIEAPFSFEGGMYSAVMYTIIGVVWTSIIIFLIVKSINSNRHD